MSSHVEDALASEVIETKNLIQPVELADNHLSEYAFNSVEQSICSFTKHRYLSVISERNTNLIVDSSPNTNS